MSCSVRTTPVWIADGCTVSCPQWLRSGSPRRRFRAGGRHTGMTGVAASSPSADEISAQVPFESLLEQLVDQTGGVILSHQRLQRLLRANLEVNTDTVGELSFPRALPRILRSASELVDARYGLLAVFDADGTLEQLFHVGVGPATIAVAIDGLSPRSRSARGRHRRPASGPAPSPRRRRAVVGFPKRARAGGQPPGIGHPVEEQGSGEPLSGSSRRRRTSPTRRRSCSPPSAPPLVSPSKTRSSTNRPRAGGANCRRRRRSAACCWPGTRDPTHSRSSSRWCANWPVRTLGTLVLPAPDPDAVRGRGRDRLGGRASAGNDLPREEQHGPTGDGDRPGNSSGRRPATASSSRCT